MTGIAWTYREANWVLGFASQSTAVNNKRVQPFVFVFVVVAAFFFFFPNSKFFFFFETNDRIIETKATVIEHM